MSLNTQLFSLQIERHVLSGFLKHPQIFPDVDSFINENDFVNPTHNTIYCLVRNHLSKGERIDHVILGQQIKNLGIKVDDDIDIFSYLKALAGSQINVAGAMAACKELVKLRVRREITETVEKVKIF
ncbi:MAG: DnaB-like helicase N-terminal domain-containing protein, partial [Nanoarchaeota archaeon]